MSLELLDGASKSREAAQTFLKVICDFVVDADGQVVGAEELPQFDAL